jgi:hypothetical protein
MDVRRPACDQRTETEVVCCGCVVEFYQQGGGVVFDKEFEAAFGGLGHFAFEGLVVDVDDSAGEGCVLGAWGEGVDSDGVVGVWWGPLG